MMGTRSSLDDQRDGAAEISLQMKETTHPFMNNGVSQGLNTENKFQSAISAWRSESYKRHLGLIET